MAYTNLPGEYAYLIDGNLGVTLPVGAPRCLIMGPAGKGLDYQPFNVTGAAISQALNHFGTAGSLVRQGYECREWGGQNMILERICARPMQLQFVGGTGTGAERSDGGNDNGYWISCRYGGTDLGTRYGVAFKQDNQDGRIIIADLLYNQRVYDNGTFDPVDFGIFDINAPSIATDGGSDIGDLDNNGYTAIPFNTATASDEYMWWYEGWNGSSISYMHLYEGIYKGFKAMEGVGFQYVGIPSRATLDASYSTDNSATAVSRGTTYPTPYGQYDKLSKVYVEEYRGKYHFYWDVNDDGTAEFFSIEGWESTTTDTRTTSFGGHVFVAADFHEANIGYLLAHNCYEITENDHFVQAAIAVTPPNPISPSNVNRVWIGTSPAFSTSLAGAVTVSADGSGLLGNKFMAGSTDFRSATAYGGFIATSEGYVDGTELSDDNDHKIDIGKYISVLAMPHKYGDMPGSGGGYYACSPSAYMGFRSTLGPKNPPTNKVVPSKGLRLNSISKTKLNLLVGMRYTLFHETSRGIVVTDAPTAARPDSDYQRQGSIEIVSFVTDGLREVGEPFIGANLTAEEEIALEKQLGEFMLGAKRNRLLRDYQLRLVITEDDRILGQATCYVDIIAPFELRQLNFKIALRRGA